MKEVTKEQFKEAYINFGKLKDGYDMAYWEASIDTQKKEDFKYLLKEPESDLENRMMLVDDFSSKEIRMFFISTDQEEQLFDNPGK